MVQPVGAAAPADPARTSSGTRRLLAALTILPAVVLTVLQLLVPSLRTIWLSLHESSMKGETKRLVGLDNYAVLGQAARGVGAGFALVLAPLVVSVIGGLLIALSVRGPSGARLGSRLVIAALLTAFAPAGVAWSYFAVLRPTGLPWLVLIMMIALTPALTALFAIVLSAVLRRWDRTGPVTLAAVGAVTLGAAIAGALQVFDIPYLTGAARTPSTLAFRLMFAQFSIGRATAVETVLLVVTGLIGIGVTAVALAMRLRFSLGQDDHPTQRRTSGALGYLGLGIAILAGVITLASMALWWIGMLSPESIRAVGVDNVVEAVLTTWLPTIAGTAIQVVVAVLAGFGIGWLRPLGRKSRWLLLLFSPWLLVAATTLAPARFLAAGAAGRAESWTALLPHSLVAVPLLMVCVLVFDALRDRFDRLGSRDHTAAVAGAGVIALVAGITLVTQALSIGRMLTGPTHHPNAAMLFSVYSAQRMGGLALPQQALMPLPLLMLLLGVSLAIQLLCAPNVRLTAAQAQTWPSRTSSAASRSSS